MKPMNRPEPRLILAPEEGASAELVNSGGTAPICLVCEHASAFIPASLDGLGLAEADRFSHAVWDIGAGALARRMAERLDAPLVAARLSRLVYDCNRPPEAPDAMPEKSELVEAPGNHDLSPEARAARVSEVYAPFQALLAATLDRFEIPPALVTIHSFSPTWFGVPRELDIGLLHDADDRLAKRLLAVAEPGLRIALNAPYSAADGVTHTLAAHAVPRGLQNVMIEVRSDLIEDEAGVDRIAGALCRMLGAALLPGNGKDAA